MNLKFTHVRLPVANYEKSFAFYSVTLGLSARFSDLSSGYGEFDTGTVTLALFDRAKMAAALGTDAVSAPERATGGPVMIFNVDDVDAACLELQRKGVVFVTPPTDRREWTIRTAHFNDPDGNLIEINSYLNRRG